MASSSQTILEKPYECLTCKKSIRLAKLEAAPGQRKQWEKYELDGITLHNCNKNKQPQQQTESRPQPTAQPKQQQDFDPSKEVMTIRHSF